MDETMPTQTSMSPQSNDGAADESLDGSARKSQKRQSGTQGSQASVQSGPPYICPTCQTNYSRLEYLRRHERRHADIRPFVCDCGKGFSRSDVLSRHKRQCAVHLNGGAEENVAEGANTLKAAATGRKASATRNKKQKTGRKSQGDESQEGVAAAAASAAAEVADDSRTNEFAQSPSQSGSFPFQTPGLPSAPPPLLPPAPYATDINNEFARVNQLNATSYGAISHHLSALNNFNNQQHNYPSSPESNGTISQHSSPRFAARDMSRHGSNGSRFSMRKGGGGSFDHITARNAAAVAANPVNHYPPEFWEALDPAAKQASDFPSSAPPTTHPTFSLSAEATAAAALANPTPNANAAAGVTSAPGAVGTPRGEPQRFSVPSGPLSPFSSIALGSSMSPYLSAFSNARDTPFVASPSRGGIPGTPGSNLNIFDWTMRPPSKPASSTNKRDSVSMQTSNSNSGTANKRKKEEDDDALANADADERSAAALLDSLRNAGRPPQTTSASSSGQAETTTSGSTPATSISETQSSTIPPSSTAMTGKTTTSAAPTANDGTTDSFFEYGDVTAGPEAFLLRLQGGVQEERLGTAGPKTTLPMVALPDMYDNGDLYLSQMGNYTIPDASWDNILLGTTPHGNAPALSSSSMGWLLSPGVQQIINSYGGTTSLPGENGNYFSGVQDDVKMSKTEDASMQINTQALEKALSEVKNPFHIPPHMLRAAYAVDHWALPSLSRLSVLALHAQQNLLKHFPILHEPTFRIDTTPGCIAFTMAMLGCYRHGRMWWTGEEAVPRKGQVKIQSEQGDVDGKPDLTAPRFDEEDGEELVRPVVMTDKTDMLMRSFASRAKTEKDKASVVQALTLFQANNFLSSDASTRSVAAINHSSLVTLAKKAGLFDATAEHSKRKVTYTGDEVLKTAMFESSDLCFSYSYLPAYLPSCSNDEKVWRRWVELAGRRRTAHLIFVMDMIARLDEGINTQVSVGDVAHLPLPTPDTVWRAPNVEQWKQALEEYAGPTLNDALTELLQGHRSSKVSIHGRHGPFARLIMLIGLLHGIVHLVEDRRKKISTPSPLALWMPDQKGGNVQDDVEMYKSALTRWREAWDEDNLCLTASVAAIGPEKAAARLRADADMSWLGNHFLFASRTASGGTPLSDDALPIYWFAVILVGQAMTSAKESQKSVYGNDIPLYLSQLAESLKTTYKDEEKIWSADRKGDNENGEGKAPADYRAMLRFAKAFVSNGEQMKQ